MKNLSFFLSIPEVVMWKSLTKPIEEQNVRAPHVEVAKKYLGYCRELLPGGKIGYVITRKGEKLYEKAQPHFTVPPDEVDVEYYVSNRIVPSAGRVLEVFKIGPRSVAARKTTIAFVAT
ncbi:hypothetical protein MUP07_06060 [Candidatus Bathyarchaeota archaeon]|nr:hypothetical protein [Candidatus Bathyarchaeota archaeon]